MPEASVMQIAMQKIDGAISRLGWLPGTDELRSCATLPQRISKKSFQNLPRVFLRKKPGANHQKPNQPKKIERTPTRPSNHE
jgi:hypothetical protein